MSSNINPVQIPTAAGLELAGGDVRHPASTDELSSATIARATRNLAARDNLLSDKLNEVISAVNSVETVVALAVPPVRLAPLGSMSALYFRIPDGFQFRVVNATVAGDQADQVRLDVIYSPFFGQETGTVVASTLSETTVGTQAFGSGGVTVRLVNLVSRATTAKASVELALIGDTVAIVPPANGGSGGGSGGTSGFSGVSGFSGFSGSVGPRGQSGYSGPAGVSGTGSSGFSGFSGFSGQAGTGSTSFGQQTLNITVVPAGNAGDSTQNYDAGPPPVVINVPADISGSTLTPAVNYLQTGDVVTFFPLPVGSTLPSGLQSGKSYIVNRGTGTSMTLTDVVTGATVAPGTPGTGTSIQANDAYGSAPPTGSPPITTFITETRTLSMGLFSSTLSGSEMIRFTGRLLFTLPGTTSSPQAWVDWTVNSTQVMAASDSPTPPVVFPIDNNKWLIWQPDPYNATKVNVSITGFKTGGTATPGSSASVVSVQVQADGELTSLTTTAVLVARLSLVKPTGRSWNSGRVVFTTKLNTSGTTPSAIENIIVKIGGTTLPWVMNTRGTYGTTAGVDSTQFTAQLEGGLVGFESTDPLVLDVYANKPAGTFVGDVETFRRAYAIGLAS